MVANRFQIDTDGNIFEVRNVGYSPLQAVIERVIEKVGSVSGPIPKNTRFVQYRGGRHHYIIEVLPSVHTIKVRHGRYSVKEHAIAMPFQYFDVAVESNYIGNVKLAWSLRRVQSIHDTSLFVPYLPNVSREGNTCLGSTGPSAQDTLVSKIEEIVDGFFFSDFNGDMGLNPAYGSFRKWEERTRQNRVCWMRWRPRQLVDMRQYFEFRSDSSFINYIGAWQDAVKELQGAIW